MWTADLLTALCSSLSSPVEYSWNCAGFDLRAAGGGGPAGEVLNTQVFGLSVASGVAARGVAMLEAHLNERKRRTCGGAPGGPSSYKTTGAALPALLAT